MNKPAPTNSNNESATCVTISPLPSRDIAPVARRPCLSGVTKSGLVARHAGANPNRTPVNNETANVKASARQFRLSSTSLGKSSAPLSVSVMSAPLPQKAKRRPAAPPKREQRAFGQQLPDETPASRADCEPHTDLRSAQGRPRQ